MKSWHRWAPAAAARLTTSSAALGVGRTASSRPCPRAGKSRVAPALSPPRRVTAVPKVYHQRNWAWGDPNATDHDWKNAPRCIATRDLRPPAGVGARPTAAHQQHDRRCRAAAYFAADNEKQGRLARPPQ